MSPIRIVLAQISARLGELESNLARHLEIVKRYRDDGTDLVVFPELSLTGYLLKDLVAEVALSREELVELWRRAGGGRPVEVVCGYVERSPGFRYYNALAHLVIDEAGSVRLLHSHNKLNLPTYGMFEEKRYFSYGHTLRAYDSPLLGRTGLLICEDMWHPANVLSLSLDGPELEGVKIIIVGSNSPARGVGDGSEEPENAAIWSLLARHSALVNNCLVLVCQRVGVEDGFVYVGASEIVAPGGRSSRRGALLKEEFIEDTIDLEGLIRERRISLPGTPIEDYDRLMRELKRIGQSFLSGGK